MTDEAPNKPSPPSLTSSTSMMLVSLGRLVGARVHQVLAQHQLTIRHLGALGHLARQPDLSYSDLARRSGVTPQSMRSTVEHLEAIGAVEQHRQGRGRPARLVVTDAGHEILNRCREAVAEIDAMLLQDLSTRDRDQLYNQLLRLVHRAFDQRPPI